VGVGGGGKRDTGEEADKAGSLGLKEPPAQRGPNAMRGNARGKNTQAPCHSADSMASRACVKPQLRAPYGSEQAVGSSVTHTETKKKNATASGGGRCHTTHQGLVSAPDSARRHLHHLGLGGDRRGGSGTVPHAGSAGSRECGVVWHPGDGPTKNRQARGKNAHRCCTFRGEGEMASAAHQPLFGRPCARTTWGLQDQYSPWITIMMMDSSLSRGPSLPGLPGAH
jgi:hypothetical protein